VARFRFVRSLAVALGCAAIPAPLLRQALAATAGTLFEAAPFVLALALGRGRLVRPFVALAGCGCGPSAGPAALSLPAAALCWAIFGPAVALARFGAALVLHTLARPSPDDHEEPDPLGTLAAIAAPAFFLAVATALAQSGQLARPWFSIPGPAIAPLEGLAGVAVGAFAPCTTAAVALAGMLRGSAPFASAGILAAAGLISPPNFRRSHRPSGSNGAHDFRGAQGYDAGFGLVIVAVGCAMLAARHGGGFVHPRLVPVLWLAVPGALLVAHARWRTSRLGAMVPALMLAALVSGSPVPGPGANAGAPDDLFPGEAFAFTGTATTVRGKTVLLRYAITCCRADASAIIVPTDLRLGPVPGSWIEARGTTERDESGLYLHAQSWKRIAAPQDPYLYR
jgi:hypothetical protein